MTVEEQADVVSGVPRRPGRAPSGRRRTTESSEVDDETVEVRVDGDDLGLLIGPKGQTLQAVQELARTVVQRQGGGAPQGRVRIDVAATASGAARR